MKKISMLFCAGVLVSVLAAVFTACNDNPNGTEDPKTKGVDVPFSEYSFEEGVPGQEISARWVNLPKENNTLLVINSDEELKNYVEGDYPTIDFSKKTLLLACGGTPNGIYKKSVKNFQMLSENKYKLSVEVILNDTAFGERWCIAILVHKISNDSNVELNTNLIRN
jgi:hypothetical protein